MQARHRSLLALCLAFMLLFAQQIGYAHAISHLAKVTYTENKSDPLPVEKLCEGCLVVAQVGSALRSEPIVFRVSPIASEMLLVDVHQLYFISPIRAFHSRAPPAIV